MCSLPQQTFIIGGTNKIKQLFARCQMPWLSNCLRDCSNIAAACQVYYDTIWLQNVEASDIDNPVFVWTLGLVKQRYAGQSWVVKFGLH